MSRLIDADAPDNFSKHITGTPDNASISFNTNQSLDDLRDEIYQDAVAHGLWEGAEYETSAQMGAEMYCAAHRIGDEVRELKDEAVRACRGEQHGYSEELADVIIMALSIAGHFGIDIDDEIRRKMAINKERPWKRGKK